MPRREYDPAAVTYAVAEVAKGRSYRELSDELAQLGVNASHETIRGWCRRAEQAAKQPPITEGHVLGLIAAGVRDEAEALTKLLESPDLDREAVEARWGQLQHAMRALLAPQLA